MRRVWIFLFFILLCSLACIATLQTGNSVYLFYAVILVPIISIINAARPRRGLRYAYFNRTIMVFGAMVLTLLAVPFAVGYFGPVLNLSPNTFSIFLMLWMV